jgi:hypothetical protein
METGSPLEFILLAACNGEIPVDPALHQCLASHASTGIPKSSSFNSLRSLLMNEAWGDSIQEPDQSTSNP